MARKLFIVFAVLFGTLTSLLVYVYLHKIEKTHVVDLRPLVVASGDITAYSIVTEENLTVIEIPTQSYPEGGIETIDELIGEKVKLDLPSNTPILQPMLVDDTMQGGMRALSIPSNIANSVGFTLKQGDKVDVLITLDNAIQIVAQDVLVLQKIVDATDKPLAYIIQVTPEQTLPITLAQQKGDVQLVLRSLDDSKQVVIPPVRDKEVIK